MPRSRRVARDVFNVDRPDRDSPTEQTCDPHSPPPLHALLSPVTEVAQAADAGAPASGGQRADDGRHGGVATASQAAPVQTTRPRGAGGKVPEPARPGRITAVPARVPADLYAGALHLVKGSGRPSWGQLVAWTCQDHPDQVRAEVARQAAAARSDRRPRGQNRPGAAGVQVTARLSTDELAILEQVRVSCAGPNDPPPTRTAVLIAAVTVAGTTLDGTPSVG